MNMAVVGVIGVDGCYPLQGALKTVFEARHRLFGQLPQRQVSVAILPRDAQRGVTGSQSV